MKIERFAFGLALPLFLLTVGSSVRAQNVVRIEEDWSLQVLEPDEQLNSPQITTAMLPAGATSGTILFLDINHGSQPDYSPGGLQLRADQNGECSARKRMLNGEKLDHASETIKWTQVLLQQGSQLKFGVVNGEGQSWQDFGGSESFIEVTTNTGSLNAYRPADSLSNSGTVYAGNRVAALTLLRVRLINSLGQMVEIPINQRPQ